MTSVRQEIAGVRLVGTNIVVWFLVSGQGLMAGPYRNHEMAIDRRDNFRVEDLGFATKVSSSVELPTHAEYAARGIHETVAVWMLAVSNGPALFFVTVKGEPMPFTAKSGGKVLEMLEEIRERRRLWQVRKD